jgi:hypothetical protein
MGEFTPHLRREEEVMQCQQQLEGRLQLLSVQGGRSNNFVAATVSKV